ncbi:Crp/Fnr family transcriptional regulator [Vibrio sp. THAF190c]|uniref:Crp/Fnr family transcriptional regulator n=1 Tax=Vibrio sp. THAF190c TaxID=2587865 RepID=UPI001267A8E1|nr:Crp/Fnr family transcriptional regulator [Vibrio sp. THAF190c]QFT12556.1 DNA-binding transcriptional dual regulator Crp [Vibrio sp. THAF190c]
MIDAHLYDQIKWPCDLSKIVIEKLKQIAVLKQGIDALEITKRYQNVPGVYYILSGSAGLCFSTQNMHHMSGGVIGRGDWIGALAVYKEYQLFAVAEEVNPLSMVFFPRKKVRDLAEKVPEVYKWLLHCATQSYSVWMQAYLTSIHEKEQKTVYVLLELAARQTTDVNDVARIDVSQSQLSSITGISRPRLNEVLKNLEKKKGIKTHRGRVVISDFDVLYHCISPMNLMLRDPSDRLVPQLSGE